MSISMLNQFELIKQLRIGSVSDSFDVNEKKKIKGSMCIHIKCFKKKTGISRVCIIKETFIHWHLSAYAYVTCHTVSMYYFKIVIFIDQQKLFDLARRMLRKNLLIINDDN